MKGPNGHFCGSEKGKEEGVERKIMGLALYNALMIFDSEKESVFCVEMKMRAGLLDT